ncbi:MAG TPA: branched-chain amino acid ABC transporter permease [Anaerolineae bacterium]|nr:branched-chain amino acid ABC transporter permease [Anaerolineae bacterium]
MLTHLLQTAIFGLATGSVIAVGAVGMTLSYGVTRFINFAYGELLTLGAFLTFVLVGSGLNLFPATLVASLLVGVIGVLIARLFYDPLAERGPFPLLITSVGVAFIVQNLLRMIFGSDPKRFPMPLLRPWHIGGVFIPKAQVGVMVAALICMLAVHLLLTYTMLGKMMRAASDNEALARVSGINTRRTIRVTWFISSAIAGLGGVLLAITQISIRPVMGWSFLLVVFAATLLGGIGRPYGAMLGALVVGLGIEFGTAYVAPDYTYAFAFVILVLVLLVRPQGLLGGVL